MSVFSTRLIWAYDIVLDFNSGRHLFLLWYVAHSNLFKRIRKEELQSFFRTLLSQQSRIE